jgi:NadR type nicotinamide-nucleotide adenylyltransferase
MVLGKFLPPHAGHVHLCEAARAMCDELTIVVGSLAAEPIAGAQRVAWMRELVPAARVVHLAAELPQQPDDHPDGPAAFWQLWRDSLLGVLPRPPDRVFTSDRYGERLAFELGAAWIPIDPGRTVFPVSGTAIRRDPMQHWAALPRCVRPHFARRVSLFGPESTGKSTLATRLARDLDTVHVPEFARAYLESRGGVFTRPELDVLAEGQIALEDALARDANRIVVCDTDPLLTVVWSEVMYGEVSAAVRAAAVPRRYDLTLLCDVDLPWVDDVVRYLPSHRAEFFARCEAALRAADRPYTIVRGSGEARFLAARAAISELMANREGGTA